MKDILLIDKPNGITSFDVIRRLRRRLGIKKMGHAGTLDPMATGLMIIGVGEGTKKLSEYLKLDKEYVAEILIGLRTTTGDITGEVVEKKEVGDDAADIFSAEKISAAINAMIGVLSLRVSAYSAIKKDGVPFYKKAYAAEKSGESIPESELPLREMKVYETELISIDSAVTDDIKTVVIKARFKVGSGTYIRSLGEELGRRLGYPATLKSLRRTKIGDFKIEDAETI